MDFKKLGLFLLLIFFLLPIRSHAQTSNAGFVPGNIWYSSDQFEEGDKIKIYTVVFNSDTREFSGTVVFFDNNVFLGKKDFVVPAEGVKEASIDWTITAGTHKIFGKIENAKFLISKGKYEEVYLAESKTGESVKTISKKIVSKSAETNNIVKNYDSIVNSVSTAGSQSIQNIERMIAEKTPEVIAQPIISATGVVEELRTNIAFASKNKKEEVKMQIKVLGVSKKNDKKIPSDPKNAEVNKFLKPFKYIELFFFTLVSFIFNNKFIFYGIVIALILLTLRYIWNLIL